MERSILITGGNSGIGLAVAEYFIKKSTNDRIWLGVRANRDAAEKLCAQYPNADLIDLDVTSEAAWQAAVEHIKAATGRFDVLVNNAGRHQDGLLATMPAAQWDSIIDANLRSVYLGCNAVIQSMMLNRFGRIVNIASLSALRAPAGQTNYAAAKAGVVALTTTLAKEVGRAGITVNALCPGYIETEAIQFMDADARKAAIAQIPARRFGKASEVAAAVHFLASEEASYINGSIIKIDGGLL